MKNVKKEPNPAPEEFNRRLPFALKDKGLLRRVFVHRSFLNEKEGGSLESNERLEFLGDAVLSNVISHVLFEKFPEIDEGELTRLRAKLVNKRTLAELAKGLEINEFLLLGKGERSTGGRENPTILAGAFEALLAAIYIDCGFKKTFEYVESLFSPLIDDTLSEPGHFDYKPRLQELSQRVFKEAPIYRLVNEDGPPHKKIFEVEVVITGKVLGVGSASKKKDAEQYAAGEALKKLKDILNEPADRGTVSRKGPAREG
jgi:ribonuclease III